jgi:hypothetical protein
MRTLLTFATFISHPPTLRRGPGRTSHRDSSVLFLLPGHPVINPIYPHSCRYYYYFRSRYRRQFPTGVQAMCKLGRRQRVDSGRTGLDFLCPHGRRNYTCVLLPLYHLSDPPLSPPLVVDHILHELNTLFLTKFRIYKIHHPKKKLPVKTTLRGWCL